MELELLCAAGLWFCLLPWNGYVERSPLSALHECVSRIVDSKCTSIRPSSILKLSLFLYTMLSSNRCTAEDEFIDFETRKWKTCTFFWKTFIFLLFLVNFDIIFFYLVFLFIAKLLIIISDINWLSLN